MSYIIKFNRIYSKLLNSENEPIAYAKLLDVISRNIEDVSAELIDWDTDMGAYPLPAKGKYLMLVFMKPGKKGLFCTFRRSTPAKDEYYRKAIGEIFFIQITANEKLA